MLLPIAAALTLGLLINSLGITKTEDTEGNHATGWWLTHVTKYPGNEKLRVFIKQYNTWGECMVQKDIDPNAQKMKEIDEKESRNAYFTCLNNPFSDSVESDL
jgi:hypothetical protein